MLRLRALNTCWRFPTSSLNSPIGLDPEKSPSSALASTMPSILRAAASSLPHHRGTTFPEESFCFPSNFPNWMNGWAEETQIWIQSSYTYKSTFTLNRSNGQSINTALFLLASFFQLISVMYINVTFTTLWYFLCFTYCLKVKLLSLPYIFQKIHLNQCSCYLNERKIFYWSEARC